MHPDIRHAWRWFPKNSYTKKITKLFFLAFCVVIYQNLLHRRVYIAVSSSKLLFRQFCEKPLHITFKPVVVSNFCLLYTDVSVLSVIQSQHSLCVRVVIKYEIVHTRSVFQWPLQGSHVSQNLRESARNRFQSPGSRSLNKTSRKFWIHHYFLLK